MRWKKIKQHPEYYTKSFYIIQKCTEEKKIQGVNFKNAYDTNFQIEVWRFEIGQSVKDCELYCVENDFSVIHGDHYFSSFRRAKEFVENKVKEYNKKILTEIDGKNYWIEDYFNRLANKKND